MCFLLNETGQAKQTAEVDAGYGYGQPTDRRALLQRYISGTPPTYQRTAPRIGFSQRLADVRAKRAPAGGSATDKLYTSRFDDLKRQQDALAADRAIFDARKKADEPVWVNPDLHGAGA